MPYFRTIMAYGCSSVSCKVIQNFSNPSISYDDIPTGTSSANNAQALNNTMVEVSTYRAQKNFLDITVDGQGKVVEDVFGSECQGVCLGMPFTSGTSVMLTAEADSGYTFS